ncbi:MAG: hypothetical protein HXY44_02775 [Syntrophaceae bacterium]|nr:hypothetical protein [Syntrophaceae bacterium]
MKIQTSNPFYEDFHSLPELIKERAEKQFVLLLENPHHPSLQPSTYLLTAFLFGRK